MCVCFFRIHVLKIAIEMWFWEVNMVFGSLVELHAWLHSCLCFFLLEKLILKASSTPPRHLAIYQASKLFLIAISTLGGLIEKVLVPSIASRHLVDQSSLISCAWCFYTSTLAWHLYLSTAKSSTPSSIELYWGSIYSSSCDPNLISLDLSLNSSISSSPKHSRLTPNLLLMVSSSFFKSFFSW